MARVQPSPFVGEMYSRMLGDQFDERTRRERETADVGGADPNAVFGRMQSDAANGPQGFNRQWIPFWEALRGDDVDMGSLGLPTHRESSRPSESPAMTSLRAKNPTDARLNDLWGQSSLRDEPSPYGASAAAPATPRSAAPLPNYYASLASLKQGR